MTERSVLSRLVSPAWLVVFAVAAFSAFQTLDPQAALRGILLTAIALILVAGVLVLPPTERDFVNAAANAALIILLLDYAALVVARDLATHTAEGVEAWHAGAWRGHLSHKNFAAPVFSVLTMLGIYCWWSGARIRGLLIALLAANFVLHTGSKTTVGFLPIAIMLVLLTRLTKRPGLTVALHIGFTGLLAALTIGTAFSTTLRGITGLLIEDTTFTGRDEIWKFAASRLNDRFWTGYGYSGFWQTPIVTGLEENFEASWDVRGIGSAHNSYLDAILSFGLPGGLIVIALLLVKPLRDYRLAYAPPESRNLADFFAMIVIFMTYIGMLESIFLNRADPMWLLLAMAILGLGLLTRVKIKPRSL